MDRNQLLNDQEEAMRLMLDGRQSTMWTALPCIVQSVDLTAMTCSAQPAIKGAVEDEDGTVKFVNLPLLVDVPIVFPSAGGFIITLPLIPTDEVLVIMASRCIDAWWQSGGIQKPMEARMHDLSDGFAIPGPRSQPHVVPSISTTAAQIRNYAGTSYVEIAADGKVKLVAPVEIDITAPTLKVNGSVVISGSLDAGAITGSSVGANGVDLETHIHIAGALVAPAGGGPVTGDTGAPV